MDSKDTARRWKRIPTPLRAGIPMLLCGVVMLLANTGPEFDPDEVIETSAHARRAFGLHADEVSHRRAIESDAAAESLERYGMALTREELVEMDRRQDVAQRIAPIAEELRNEAPDSFAAMYLDHEDGGAVVVLATNPDQIDSGKVAGLADGSPFRIQRVERSARQLRSDHDSLQLMAAQLRDTGEKDVIGWELDETANTIRVLLREGADERRIAPALAALGAPSYVEFEERHVSTMSAVRGGDALTTCSAGPQAYRDIPQLGGRFYYTLTAEHCPNAQSHTTPGHGCAEHKLRHDVRARPNQTIYGPAIFADVQMHWSGATQGYVGGNRPVVNEDSLGWLDAPGTPVCKRGKTTGTTCGNRAGAIASYLMCSTASGFDVCGNPGTGDFLFILAELRKATGMATQGGDSGGVVYWTPPGPNNEATIVGLVSLSNGVDTWYSHILFIHQELNEEGYPFIVQRWWDNP